MLKSTIKIRFGLKLLCGYLIFFKVNCASNLGAKHPITHTKSHNVKFAGSVVGRKHYRDTASAEVKGGSFFFLIKCCIKVKFDSY